MDIQVIGSLIASIGFPCVIAVIMILFLKEEQKAHTDEIKSISEAHKEETKGFTDAYVGNTVVLTELKQLLADKLKEK